eukprot:29352-Rhodomonas_salina.8
MLLTKDGGMDDVGPRVLTGRDGMGEQDDEEGEQGFDDAVEALTNRPGLSLSPCSAAVHSRRRRSHFLCSAAVCRQAVLDQAELGQTERGQSPCVHTLSLLRHCVDTLSLPPEPLCCQTACLLSECGHSALAQSEGGPG